MTTAYKRLIPKLKFGDAVTRRGSCIASQCADAIALLTPSSAMPRKPKKMQRLRLWSRQSASTKSCSATLTMMPAVTANMHA
ncbi:hypothetical protein HYQ46_010766 [Verticillium longisporum]|nr:hypothetical protein HYQ46_010766 [Verticillium longisporum]